MPQVNIVAKTAKITKAAAIKYQLITHCFIENIHLSNSDLDCLIELALLKEAELNSFCKHLFEKKIFKSAQTVRNSLNKSEKNYLIVKSGRNRKVIQINPDIKIQTEGNILLDYKLLALESEES